MTTTTLQIRCATCDGLLADVLNVIGAGYVVLDLNCAMCSRPRMEIVGWLDREEPE